jgi:hypothetical protein
MIYMLSKSISITVLIRFHLISTVISMVFYTNE